MSLTAAQVMESENGTELCSAIDTLNDAIKKYETSSAGHLLVDFFNLVDQYRSVAETLGMDVPESLTTPNP